MPKTLLTPTNVLNGSPSSTRKVPKASSNKNSNRERFYQPLFAFLGEANGMPVLPQEMSTTKQLSKVLPSLRFEKVPAVLPKTSERQMRPISGALSASP